MDNQTPSSGFQPPSPVEESSSPPIGEGNRASKEAKQRLRKWAKNERKKLDLKQISHKLVLKLQETNEYKQAKNIMIYYPLKDEVDLLYLLEDETKKFFLPKIDGKNLLCCPYNKEEKLCKSCFNTNEPTTNPVCKTVLDLIIVPALAVDKNNYRLGYGCGFYDRFLKDINAYKIVCISQNLVVTTVYPETHDIKIDKIITI